MNLVLNLYEVNTDLQIPFCEYLIDQIKDNIEFNFNSAKCIKAEQYINENNIIDYQIRVQYTRVYDLYRLAVNNLNIHKRDEGLFEINLDKNINIPNSYTKLYNIISLLEYGSLSLNKCEILAKIFDDVSKNLDMYFQKFISSLEVE